MISFLLAAAFLLQKLENPTSSFPNIYGATGTLRGFSAIPNKPSTFGASFIANFFAQEPFIDNIKNSRNQFRVDGNYTFDIGIPLEIFGGTTLTYNDNSTASRAITMTTFFENLDAGVRLAYPVIEDSFYLGGFSFLRFLSGTRAPRNTSGGLNDKSGPMVSGQIGLIESFDLKKASPDFPIRQHFHIAYRAPNGDLNLPDDEFNRFALDSYKYHAAVGTLGLEVPLRWVTPFIEYSLEANLSQGSENIQFADNRQKATFGTRISPLPSFSILTAIDWGFNGPKAEATTGIPRNPQFDFFIGLTFQALGDSLNGEIGSARGIVSDEKTGSPLQGVTITVMDDSVAPVVTDENGNYEFPHLKNGNYQVKAQKEGYEPITRPLSVRDGSDTISDLGLRAEGPKTGGLNLSILDGQTQEPVKGASIRVEGLTNALASDASGKIEIPSLTEGVHEVDIESPGFNRSNTAIEIKPNQMNPQTILLERAAPQTGTCSGIVRNADGTPLTAVLSSENGKIPPFGTDPLTGGFSQTLPAGTHNFRVQAENYLPQTITCTVEAGQASELTVNLEKPKEAVVVGDKIVLPDAIYFDFGKASIKKESLSILDQVASLLLKEKGYKLLKVEGHTDDVGSDAFNQKLSEDRAKSVKRYLTLKGVSAKKVEALGFGEANPVSTNLTPEGRSENRRVEFNLIRD